MRKEDGGTISFIEDERKLNIVDADDSCVQLSYKDFEKIIEKIKYDDKDILL